MSPTLPLYKIQRNSFPCSCAQLHPSLSPPHLNQLPIPANFQILVPTLKPKNQRSNHAYIHMEKIPKTQIFKTAILFAFLLVIPFISSSLRTSYLYFILNLLILFLAIESGVLAAASEPIDDKTKHTLLHPYLTSPLLYNNSNLINSSPTNATTVKTLNDRNSTMWEKSTTTRTMLGLAVAPVVEQNILKKCPSRPSLFFIGGLEEEKEEITVQEEVRSVAKIDDFYRKKNKKTEEEENDDDLFLRAEMFIGNFYKQLKIQREDSWKRIHGICRKAL